MPRFLGRDPLRRKHLRFAATVAAGLLTTLPLAAFTSGALAPSPGAAQADPTSLVLTGPTSTGVTLSVTPKDLSTLRQGDTVHLHFSGLTHNGDSVLVGTCPAGLPIQQIDFATYGSAATQEACLAKLPTGLGGDIDPNAANNPGLSTSVYAANPRADGTLDVDYLVGSGDSVGTTAYTLLLKNGDQKAVNSLTCDSTHSCVIGFEVTRGVRPYSWRDLSTLKISPAADTTDTTGCQGLSQSTTVNGAGPERMQDPIAALNAGYCATTSSPIPISYVPSGGGEDDPTGVAAVGNGTDVAFAGSPLLAKHPLAADQVAVPIALNAVELAQWGGASQPSINPSQLAYNKLTLPGLALKPSDVAGIVLHDYPLLWPGTLPKTLAGGRQLNPLAAALMTRPGNAAAVKGFDPSLIGLPMLNAPTVTYSLGEDSTAIALSSYLTAQAGSAWTFPKNTINDEAKRSGQAVGAIDDFDQIVDHTDNGSKLTSQTSSTSGLYNAKFSKDITSGTQTYLCPDSSISGATWQLALTKACVRFGVMDAGTADVLGFTATRLASGRGYVAPTAPALTAAAGGSLNDDGYFDTSSATAYPLTYVEYAVVSTAPLLTSTCKPRTAQQDELKSFLQYAVAAGQSQLPAGLAPLSSTLASQATTAIDQIGTGAATGTCGASTSTSASSGGGSTTGSIVAPSGGNLPSGSGSTTVPSKATPTPSTTVLPRTEPVSSTIPAFGRMAQASSFSVLIGLLLLTAMVSAAAVGVANGVGPRELLTRARALVGRGPA